MRHAILIVLALSFALGSCCGKPFCTADTCQTGCCDEFDRCLLGDDQLACGWGGRTCVNCAGRECRSFFSIHACEGSDSASCSSANCAGCCNADGSCVSGTSAAACGAAGNTCANCMSIGKNCSSGDCR